MNWSNNKSNNAGVIETSLAPEPRRLSPQASLSCVVIFAGCPATLCVVIVACCPAALPPSDDAVGLAASWAALTPGDDAVRLTAS
jgi:hypothetical protein